MNASHDRTPSAAAFVAQLAALGFFSRIILILAILGLLSLNDYFTTPSQIPALLPVSAFIILLLVLVTLTDSIATKIIQRLIRRIAAIHTLFGFEGEVRDPDQSSAAQQRQYLRAVFFPFVMSVLPAPLIVAVLLSTTPLLLIISIVQALTNSFLVFRYNKLIAVKSEQSKQEGFRLSETMSSEIEDRAYLLRRGQLSSQARALDFNSENLPQLSLAFQAKRDALRTSNLVFRALILVASALLAIYRLSSLGSLVGFFLLNNTLRYAIVVVAEYVWPSYRHLTFRQACEQIRLALTAESKLLERLQIQQEREEQAQLRFDERMSERLSQRPYLRFKEFCITQPRSDRHTVIDSLTGRVELSQITLVRVCSSSLCGDLVRLIQDRDRHAISVNVKGVAVCAQLSIDAAFWNHLPVADPQRCHTFSTSLATHFSLDHRPLVNRFIDAYNLTNFYLEGDPEPLSVQLLSSKQIKRMRSIMTLLDLIIHRRCLWLAPFVLDPFEQSEALSLLSFYKQEMAADQRTVFLLSRPLPVVEGYRYYDLSRTSLKSST